MIYQESKMLRLGEIVAVRVYGGNIVHRRVVAVKDRVVVICNEDEWLRSIEERREANGIGFPHADVIGRVSEEAPRAADEPGQGGAA